MTRSVVSAALLLSALMGSTVIDVAGRPAHAQIYVQPARTVEFPQPARTVEFPQPARQVPYPSYATETQTPSSNSGYSSYPGRRSSYPGNANPRYPARTTLVPQFWQQTYQNGNYNPLAVPGW